MSVFEFESREKFIAEVFPNGRPTELGSRDLLRANAVDQSVSRKRLLETGLRTADEDLVKTILNEYACVVGIDSAIQTYMAIWGNMVTQGMDEESETEDHQEN